LLENDADINVKTNIGESALFIATKYGYIDTAQFLVCRGADVETTTDNRIKPLHEATARGSIDIVTLLLDYGADIESVSDNGARCVHIAARNGCLDILQLLLRRGALLDSLDCDGKSCIHYAAYYCTENDWIAQANRLDCIRYLLNQGANIDLDNLEEGYRTAIELAASTI
jgi:ankyrin repeat protein